MNANKQDAGGLPELPPLPASTLADHWHTKQVMHTYSAAQMREYARAYGEQCRAAPGGAELFERFAREFGADLTPYPDKWKQVGVNPPYKYQQANDLWRAWQKAHADSALSRGVLEVEPFVSCTCHEERQKQLCLNRHRCVRAYPLAAIAAQRKEGA